MNKAGTRAERIDPALKGGGLGRGGWKPRAEGGLAHRSYKLADCTS